MQCAQDVPVNGAAGEKKQLYGKSQISIPSEEIIYDPFLGSGSTLIAAGQLKRVCYGLEINPAYVDMIVTRWEKLTGQRAVLEADGRGFEQVRGERCGAREGVSDAAA